MIAFTEFDLALTTARERANTSSAADTVLTQFLHLSMGIAPDDVTHFRPYYVAATFIKQNPKEQRFSRADDAYFTGLVRVIESLLALQAAYDNLFELTIPPGFVATPSTAYGLVLPTTSLPTRTRL